MRLALTDAEREVFSPGVAVQTDGVKQFTTRHMNLNRTLVTFDAWAPRRCRRCKSTNWADSKERSVCLDCGLQSP